MNHPNPIIDSLIDIKTQEIREEFYQAEILTKQELGDNYNHVMTLLSKDIKDVQAEACEFVSCIIIVLAMCEEDGDKEQERLNRYLKACAMWMLEKGER